MRPAEDITARARIRDAAMRLFAERGAKPTTIRAVAQEAGVTPGLVSHHFGSKQGLREACDTYVLDYLRELLHQAVDEGRVADPAFIGVTYRSVQPVFAYLAHAFVDGSAAAGSLFDSLVAMTEEYLTAHPPQPPATRSDTRTQAAVLVAMRLGVWVLHGHLARALDAEDASPQFFSRVGTAELDIISADFAGTDLMDMARTGIDRLERK